MPDLRKKGLVAVCGALLVPLVTLSAQRSQMSRSSLLTVPAVLVEVEGVDSTARADGLVPDSILSDIEAQLAGARIQTLSEPQWQQMIGNPALVVKFELLKTSRFVYIYRIGLELRQMSVLTRDTTKLVYTTTWSAGSRLGSTGPRTLGDLRRQIPMMVQWFIDDYWAARDSRDDSPIRDDVG